MTSFLDADLNEIKIWFSKNLLKSINIAYVDSTDPICLFI